MIDLYDFLRDTRPSFIGPKHWLGNLRWFAQEEQAPGSFTFKTAPKDCTEQERGTALHVPAEAIRTLFGVEIAKAGGIQSVCYRPDGMTATFDAAQQSIMLPLERYGALVRLESGSGAVLSVKTARALGRQRVVEKGFRVETVPGLVVWTDGGYTIAFRCTGQPELSVEGSFSVRSPESGPVILAVAFHPDAATAISEAETLFTQSVAVEDKSKLAWEEYLSSCPVAEITEDYVWEVAGEKIVYFREEIRRRQYWHWQGLLANVYELPFNELKAYMAPDKSNWYGVWSNDGPDAIRVLAHTSRHGLARQCIVEYIRTALSSEGDLAWYLHATGQSCLGAAGDSGRLSHGVPLILKTVAEYIEVTGDVSVLDEAAGAGGTVWEKLKRYMRVVFQHRDVNADGLVEWCNLWEGGADDKVGCFFSAAPLESWVEAVVNYSEAGLAEFYGENSRPTVNLYEQAFFLHALRALEKLAIGRGELEVANEAREKFDHIVRVLEERHWNEADGFYYDWDVRAERQTRAMNQDAFYLLNFLRHSDRVRRVIAHLNNPDEFALRHIPTLAKNAEGFRPDGYWCGGFWPRESSYIGDGLRDAGDLQGAYEVVLRALCCGQGKVMLENVNPLTGRPNTPIFAMAYNALLNLILIAIRKEMEMKSRAKLAKPVTKKRDE